jgi:dTDP-L-rhamnose 4-epimerase
LLIPQITIASLAFVGKGECTGMKKAVLITGGAGFIGSHVADELLRNGYAVRALDNLSPQVHGSDAKRPDYLDEDVELIVGDVRDRDVVRRALDGVDSVFHFASLVGVGQSMYEVQRYTDVNNVGTAVLLEALIERATERPVERLVVASSMSLYGEGLYRTADGNLFPDVQRSLEQLKGHRWEPEGDNGEALLPIATPETKPPSLASVYALSKFDQERLCLLIGRSYNISTAALRFFNVYGPRQALSNPYTGVLAIFASRLLNDKPPLINEDGLQRRDFVSVYDVARACRLAMEVPEAAGQVFNVGSGRNYTVLEIAERIGDALGKQRIQPEITGKYRMGDIRHCFADITLAREILGYRAEVALEEGLVSLAGWLEGQAAIDRVAEAGAELSARGLTV